jgi:hypothetical protein
MRSLDSQQNATEQLDRAPRALRESLMFPYESGLTWATALYQRGGWNAVSNAFTKLPQSTEQIMHPDKYFAYEAPLKMTLPELNPQLGPTWKHIDSDVNGEWGCYLLLAEYLNDSDEAKQAAAGWSGDEFALYEGAKPSDLFVAQITAWDTPQDAREFFDAYLKRTWKRYPDAEATQTTSTTERGDRREWKTPTSHGVLELRGSRVLILEGIPEKANTTALLNRIWHQG